MNKYSYLGKWMKRILYLISERWSREQIKSFEKDFEDVIKSWLSSHIFMDEFSHTGKKREADTFFDIRKTKMEVDKIICRELVKFSYFYEQI